MKQLAVFFIMLVIVLCIDFTPADLNAIRSQTIKVTIEGEVINAGEIEMPLYATVQDALDIAGVTDQSDISGLNPMTVLTDHDVLFIPAVNENTAEKISINTATAEELCSLPGIGESTALKIILYREEEGMFQTLEELMNVKGIGEAKFEKLKELIRL